VTGVQVAPGRTRLALAVGVLLMVPRLVLAWFLGLEVLQLVASFLLIAGLVVVGVTLFRLLLARRAKPRGWPLALAGAVAVVVAGLLTPLLHGTPVAYSGGVLVPAPVVLFQYAWTLVGAVWVIGLVFVFGSVSVALRRR
jgi:hypothetical protein